MSFLNKYKFAILVFAFAVIGTSCEDKIDVELEEADIITVVDAFLNTNEENQELSISKTQNYFINNSPEPVLGAEVMVSNDAGASFVFEDQGDGTYVWTPSAGQTLGSRGSVMNLSINTATEEISSTITVGRSPIIEEIRQEERDDIFGKGKYLQFIARDFEGYGDTYWIKSFRNGNYLNLPSEINLAWDATFDSGAETDGLIFIPPIRELINPLDSLSGPPWETGDICRVEIHSLSPEVFSFMETVRDQLINGDNGIFAEPLINAPSNLIETKTGNRVLGAFCVSEVSSLEKVVD